MKVIPASLLSFFFCLPAGIAVAQSSAPQAPDVTSMQVDQKTPPIWIEQFNKLDTKQKQEYVTLFRQAEILLSQNRILETLRLTEQLEKIFDGNPGLYNVRGSCYIKLKDVDNAIVNFRKALAITPDNMSIAFNLAEANFVKHDYKTAAAEFQHILDKPGDNDETPLFMKSLIQFKIFLCYTKLNEGGKAASFADLYTRSDDTPYFYFVDAVKKISAGDKEEGQKSILSALRIFGDSGMFQAFSDSMAETGLISTMDGQTVPEHPAMPQTQP